MVCLITLLDQLEKQLASFAIYELEKERQIATLYKIQQTYLRQTIIDWKYVVTAGNLICYEYTLLWHLNN